MRSVFSRSKSSTPSRRVRFATERTTRSPHSSSYGNDGMSLMWMPAQTTLPPLTTLRSAATTSSPAGAKMIAASSGRDSDVPPAQIAPMRFAKACAATSPSRVKAETSRASAAAICATLCAAGAGAGEARPIPEVPAAARAVRAAAAGPAEPRHADAAAAVVDADDLMSEDERELRVGKLAVSDVEVGAADGAGGNADAELAGARDRRRNVAQRQRRALMFEEHRSHKSERSVPVKFFYEAWSGSG